MNVFYMMKARRGRTGSSPTLNAEHQLNFCAEEVEAKGAPEKLKIPQLNLGYEGNQQTRRQRHVGCDPYIQNNFVGR